MKKYAYVSLDKEEFWIEYGHNKIYKIKDPIYELNPRKEEINLSEKDFFFHKSFSEK